MDASLIAELGKLFPVINGGLLVTLITIFLKNRFENRKLTTEVNGEMRKEFIEEMERIREESKGLREEVVSLRRENGQLRDEVRSLNEIITGMSRQNASSNRTAQRILAEQLPHSPEIDRALNALGNVEGDKSA